jgi:hypothetical protein
LEQHLRIFWRIARLRNKFNAEACRYSICDYAWAQEHLHLTKVQWFSIFWTDGTSVKPRRHKKIKEKFYGLYTDLMDVLER